MIITFDARTLLEEKYSGVPEYTLNIAQGFLMRSPENLYRFFYNSFLRDLNKNLFQGKNIEFIRSRYPNFILNYFSSTIYAQPKMERLCGKTDVFLMPNLNFIGKLFPLAKNILTVHDLSFLRHKEFFSFKMNLWHDFVNIKKIIKKFDHVVAVSEHTKYDLMDLCGVAENRISVVYSGVGSEYQKIDNLDILNTVSRKYNLPKNFLFYLGTLEPRKNVDGIIRAYNILRQKHFEFSDVKLVLAGASGWKNKSIYRAAKKSKYSNDIVFLGYVDKQDKPALYTLAKCFVYPSFYEGFGLPPLEAMACGVPTIVSSVTSLPEVVGDAGVLVDPFEADSIYNGIISVLSDKKFESFLREKSVLRAKKFSWDKTVDEYLRLF